jgi:arylsulfatase A-like enzyme
MIDPRHPHPSATRESGPRARDGAIRAALAGACAGLAAGLLDTHQAWSEVDGPGHGALLALQTAGLLIPAGGGLGILTWAGSFLGARAWRLLGRDPGRGSAWMLTLLAASPLAWIALRLFQGGVTSQLPARWLLIPAVALILAAVFHGTTRLALGLIARSDRAGRGVPWLLAAAAAFLLSALGLRFADAHLYRRLYQFLHLALAAGTLGGIAVALRLAVFSRWPRTGRGLMLSGWLTLACSAALLAGMLVTRDSCQVVKVALHERTATAANLLLLAGRSAVPPASRPSAEARRLHYERERAARAAATGSAWPALPGAHLVLITIDALRADRLGCLGHRSRDLTPRLDRLAAGAVLFERAYCPAPHSSFSISSLHTSRDLHEEAAMGRELEYPTLAGILGRAGYQTLAFYTNGIFHTEGDKVGHYRRGKFGFETVHHGAPRPEELTDHAIAELDRLIVRGEPPLFAWVHYFNVHEPYLSTRFGPAAADRYDGEILEADAAVGRLVDWIDAKLARDVVLVVSADHGEEFLEHGGYYHGSSLYDEQVRVPLILRIPGAGSKRVASPVSTLDMAPTVLGILGLDVPERMIGRDLRPAVFGGEQAHVARPVFSAVMRRQMVVRWPWKLVADRSRGLYELYDLDGDPLERVNRYDERRELARGLLGEIDLRADLIGREDDPVRTVLNLARAQDPRALPGLLDLIRSAAAAPEHRIEALALIGALGLPEAADRGVAVLIDDADARLATAAALALGELGDRRGETLMEDALFDGDPRVRDRAALALARLGNDRAVEPLIEALGRDDLHVRENAIRLLGQLGDPLAVEPLIETIAEERTRYLSVLALGKLRDPRALPTLMDVLAHETHTDVRGYAVLALGWLGLAEAVPALLRILAREPGLRFTAESLVRLGAVGTAPLFGTDLDARAAAPGRGWSGCHAKPAILHDEFLGRTTCRSAGQAASLRFAADLAGDGVLIARGRHLAPDPARTIPLAIEVDGRTVATVELTGELGETRLPLPAGSWPAGERLVTLRLAEPGRLELDHLLLLDVGAIASGSF